MRITAYVAVSGERTLTRFLQPDMAQVGDVSPDGKFDEIKARKALADIPGIVPSADDSTPVYAFALQFIEYAHKMLAQLADKGDNVDTPQNRADERCVKRMDGGKCAFARVDVKWCTDHLRVRIEGANPHGLVGSVDNQVRETCVFFAYVVQAVKANLTNGDVIRVVEGPCGEGCIEAARQKKIESELWHKGAKCERRKIGRASIYCSPADPTCGNYDCGRCKWRPEA